MSTSKYPKGHALIVAIANYHHINSLPDVVLNDAKAMVDVLSSPQYCGYELANITQLLDERATRKAVLAGLDNLAAQSESDDIVCVYFSGHGALTGGPDESSLLTVDCRVSDLAGTSISAIELSDALNQIKAKRLLVILDACHAAGAGTVKSAALTGAPILGLSEKTISRLAEGVGRALMASSRPSETSLIMHGAQNSAFTEALLEGLKGGADRNSEGVIRVFDLFDYVANKVPITTQGAQHPIFKAAQLENNFPIALSSREVTVVAVKNATPSIEDFWQLMSSVLPELYPLGPNDQEIWERAGGDVSRLRLQGSGRSAWFASLKLLKLGGGGEKITIYTLFEVAREDFQNHPGLQALQ
jgi:hypothetical protein